MEVRVVVRCQRSDFPREATEKLYDRVRDLAKDDLTQQGYAEIESREQSMLDPGDKNKTLDTWYELVFSKTVDDADTAISEAKRTLKLEKYCKA